MYKRFNEIKTCHNNIENVLVLKSLWFFVDFTPMPINADFRLGDIFNLQFMIRPTPSKNLQERIILQQQVDLVLNKF